MSFWNKNKSDLNISSNNYLNSNKSKSNIKNSLTGNLILDTFYVYHENNYFFEFQIRTGILKTIIDKLSSFISLSKNQLYYLDVPQTNLQIKNSIITLDSISKDLTTNLLLYNLVYIKYDIQNKTISIKTPMEIKEEKDLYIEKKTATSMNKKITYLDYKSKNQKIVDQKYYYFKIKLQTPLISNSTLELVLLYSEMYTSFEKEIRLTSIKRHMDEGYVKHQSYLDESYIITKTPESMNLDENQKPLYEFSQPDIRSTEFLEMRELLLDEITLNLGVDKYMMSLTSTTDVTATEVEVKSNSSAQTIKQLQQQFEVAINKTIKNILLYFDSNLVNFPILKIEEFNPNPTAEIDNAINLYRAGLILLEDVLKILNLNLNDDEIKLKTYILMFQKQIPFTFDQQKEAIQMGVFDDSNL